MIKNEAQLLIVENELAKYKRALNTVSDNNAAVAEIEPDVRAIFVDTLESLIIDLLMMVRDYEKSNADVIQLRQPE